MGFLSWHQPGVFANRWDRAESPTLAAYSQNAFGRCRKGGRGQSSGRKGLSVSNICWTHLFPHQFQGWTLQVVKGKQEMGRWEEGAFLGDRILDCRVQWLWANHQEAGYTYVLWSFIFTVITDPSMGCCLGFHLCRLQGLMVPSPSLGPEGKSEVITGLQSSMFECPKSHIL